MPLNPRLYDDLKKVFGSVKLANEGEPMSFDRVNGKIVTREGEAGEYYCVCCPYCGDTRHRLWINHKWNTVGTVDGERISFGRHLAVCFNEHCDLSGLESMMLFRPPVDLGSQFSNTNGLAPRQVEGKLPDGCIRIDKLSSDHTAVQYMRQRNYDIQELADVHNTQFCVVSTEFPICTGRLIFPVYRDSLLVGWQARYVGTPPNKRIPKYYTMPGMKKTRVLYNLNHAQRYPFVVVVEGPLDAIRVGGPAVALFGKKVSTSQFEIIRSIWRFYTVILMLDADATDEISDFSKLASRQLYRHAIVTLPVGTDPGDYSRESLWEMIFSSARANGIELTPPVA